MSVFEILSNALFFLVAIIVLVGVHEFGHFYVARKCGVQVLRFSLGFGNVIWRKTDAQGTEFVISSVPLGGYVRMLDEREGDVPEALLSKAFNRKALWQRTLILLGGPAANLILALLLTWGLLLKGETGLIPIVGKITPQSLAANAGFEFGQEILVVDGKLTPTTRDVMQQLYERIGDSGKIEFRVRYPNSLLEYELSMPIQQWLGDSRNPDPLTALGLDFRIPQEPIIGEVIANKPAEKAGFKVGDRILKVNQLAVKDWSEWYKEVRSNPNQELIVLIERSGSQQEISVTPESFKEEGVLYGRVGVGSAPLDEKYFKTSDYTLGGALVLSVVRNWEGAGMQLSSLKKLIFGEISTKNLSGAVGIAKVAGSSARRGFETFVRFLALFSLFLGVINLLPIPVLDGGHLLFFAIEFFKGKPVSEKVQMIGTQIGLSLVVTMMLFAFYNDIFLS